MSELHEKARDLIEHFDAHQCDQWKDIIAALLAENERLADALAAQVAATNGASACALRQSHRAEAAEAAIAGERKRADAVIVALRSLRDVCTTPGETKADFVERIKDVLGSDPDARVEALYAAEARLKALCEAEPVALKGVGRINGDGWKDTTTIGQVVFVWNAELPEPYAPGQFPRIGNPIWSASTDQYDFVPASAVELRQFVEGAIAAVLIPRPSMEGGK